MPIMGIFDIGKSAILASQIALDVTANNIANVNTPGFSRKEAVLDIPTPMEIGSGFVGRGVRVSRIRRLYDRFLENQIMMQKQYLGRATIMADLYSQVEEVFNEQQNPGISASMNDYFNAWQEVADNPDELAQRSSLIKKAETLINVAKDTERALEDSMESIKEDITDTVNKINDLAEEIAGLNKQIIEIEAGSTYQANDLRDKRETLLGDLAQLIEFTTIEDDFGGVTVIAGGVNIVDGERYKTLTTDTNADGSLSVKYNNEDIGSRLNRGRLSGLIASYDEINSTVLKNLRKTIASLIKETNLQHRQGYGLDGNTGRDFFGSLDIYSVDYSDGASITSANITDLTQLNLHEYEIRFTDPTTYQVYDTDSDSVVATGTYTPGGAINFDGIQVVIDNDTGTPATGDKFFITPLHNAIKGFSVAISSTDEIAAAEDPAALPGDNRNALQMVDLYQSDITDLGGSYNDFYNAVVSTSGTMSRAAKDKMDFEQRLLDEMNLRRDSISGVNLDEEAANLIRFQKSYEAGARLIKLTDELLEVIINL
ncbi:MAG TPA: flagellar hook-associated protein FlgK [Nitrospirae bacterium]|nr:flagellar hook-associated protein FlgK [Nitrospirota bacterium]